MRNPFEVYTSITDNRKNRPLDWEESAADMDSRIDGVHDAERKPPALHWLAFLLTVVFVSIAARLFYLQVLKGSDFRQLSETNRVRSRIILAPRGLIVDRNGEILAQNTASFNLVATPFDLPKTGLADMVKNLAGLMNLSADDLNGKLKNINRASVDPVMLAQDISPDQSILFDTHSSEYVGFFVQKIPIREYPEPQVFSHVLGYTGLVGSSDLPNIDASKYAAVDYIGKSGLEQNYENFLHGVNGEDMVEVDATGKLLNILGEKSPEPGQTLVLNIDKGLQKELYNSLVGRGAGRRAAAVALNPKNGQVLALLSLPGFDNNLFAHGIKSQDFQNLLNDKNLPLFNRVIAGTYPPGSTSKIMTAAAGLQEGVIKEDTVIYDSGVLSVPNQYGNTSAYLFRGWKPGGLGPMTVRSAIAMSSDIYFYTVAGGSPNGSVAGLGAQKLADYFRKFHLGQPLGIDLQGEKGGLVPDPEWKREYFKNDPLAGKWYLGDTYHLGIGQGDLLVTPLQVAEWTAAVANNGVGMKPEVAQKVLDKNGVTVWENKEELIISGVASFSNIRIVQEGMRQTVTAGTAKSLSSLPVSSAGKTGTSQFDGSDPGRTHAWFTVYAPYEDPQIVITVLVEAGGEGNAASLPVAKDALEWWAKNRYGK